MKKSKTKPIKKPACNHFGTFVFVTTEEGVTRTCTRCGFHVTEIGRHISIQPLKKYKKKKGNDHAIPDTITAAEALLP